MVANALELHTMKVGELREQLAKYEQKNASLRERLTSMRADAASAGAIALTGLSITAGATAGGALDGMVLGENIARVQPFARPSTIAGALALAAAAYMGSPALASFAGGMLAPPAYERGATLALSVRGRLTTSEAPAKDGAATAAKAAA